MKKLTMHIGRPYAGEVLCDIDITKQSDSHSWASISDLVLNRSNLKPHFICQKCASKFMLEFVEEGILE